MNFASLASGSDVITSLVTMHNTCVTLREQSLQLAQMTFLKCIPELCAAT